MRVTGYEHVASATLVYSRPYAGAFGEVTSWGVMWVSMIWI